MRSGIFDTLMRQNYHNFGGDITRKGDNTCVNHGKIGGFGNPPTL